ncbi:MAG: C25 family peptidase propeptide domain-containing protein [Anaerolineae bacterium]
MRVPGYALNDVPGAPQLPVYSVVFKLPPEGDWKLAVRTAGSRILPQRLAIPAAPVPNLSLHGPKSGAQRAELPGVVPTVDRPDPAIYQHDAFYPASPAVAGDVQWQRGRRLLAVRVFPFQYNPATQEVLYHLRVEVVVQVQGEGGTGGRG